MFYTASTPPGSGRSGDGWTAAGAGDGWIVARSARGQVAYRLPVHAPGQHL